MMEVFKEMKIGVGWEIRSKGWEGLVFCVNIVEYSGEVYLNICYGKWVLYRVKDEDGWVWRKRFSVYVRRGDRFVIVGFFSL